MPPKLQAPLLNALAVIVGASIGLTGIFFTRPKPLAPPKQASAALLSWEQQTNTVQQSLVEFMYQWPDQLAKHLECEVADLPSQNREAADKFYDLQFRLDEIARQETLAELVESGPQHVNAQMRVWFGGVEIASAPDLEAPTEFRDYLGFGQGYTLFKKARQAIHESALSGQDPSKDAEVKRLLNTYLFRRIIVSELSHGALAEWYIDMPRSWKYSRLPDNNFKAILPEGLGDARPESPPVVRSN